MIKNLENVFIYNLLKKYIKKIFSSLFYCRSNNTWRIIHWILPRMCPSLVACHGIIILLTCVDIKDLLMPRDKRQKRDLHALNEEGMIMCNPRDKEAVIQGPNTEGIGTDYRAAVTRHKCLALIYKQKKALEEQKGRS